MNASNYEILFTDQLLKVNLKYFMFRDVPTFGLYMLTYEHILCWFKKKEDRSSYTSITSQFVAGGLAGIV